MWGTGEEIFYMVEEMVMVYPVFVPLEVLPSLELVQGHVELLVVALLLF